MRDIGDERGVVAAQARFVGEVDLLLSYDVSGSIEFSQLANAKEAGRTLLSLLEAGDENHAALHAFSSSARQLVPFVTDFGQVLSGIEALVSGGSTALYDAVLLAGRSAAGRATERPGSRTIVILFTDGMENSSVAREQQAVEAISRIGHPEIDEVFLVFVGAAEGSESLSNLAARAGRRFFRIENFDDLTIEFQTIVQAAP